MIDRRYFRYFDWVSFILMILLVGIGLLFVFSSTYHPEKPFSIFFKKQLFGVASGLVLYFFCCLSSLRNAALVGYFAYYGALLLLGYTIIGGWIGLGAQRWISLYFIRFQPSELAKFLLPVFIVGYLNDNDLTKYKAHTEISIRSILYPFLAMLLSFILILKQPDLGTALIVLFSGMTIFWFVGVKRKFFITLGCCVLLGAPALWTFMKPYQQRRVKVLFGYGEANKERYQIEQSKIAIGSGGVFGKGLLKGTQNRLDFLPEDHTDFIFSIICEEWGFIGAFLVLFLYALLFIRLIVVLCQVTMFFDQIIALGMLIHILFSVCVNVGMVIGMLPIVGIPLPLLSYGVSNLWITLISFGWLNNIAIRRFYVG